MNVKIRVLKKPREPEMDGVRLDDFRPGAVRDVSSSIGSWLIAQRYAEPEMRDVPADDDLLITLEPPSKVPAHPRRRSSDGPRRRSTDR